MWNDRLPDFRRSRQPVLIRRDRLDDSTVLTGMLIGLALGALWALLNAPRSGKATRALIVDSVNGTGESIKEQIERVVPGDTVGDSMAEGKELARRRREQLGLGSGG